MYNSCHAELQTCNLGTGTCTKTEIKSSVLAGCSPHEKYSKYKSAASCLKQRWESEQTLLSGGWKGSWQVFTPGRLRGGHWSLGCLDLSLWRWTIPCEGWVVFFGELAEEGLWLLCSVLPHIPVHSCTLFFIPVHSCTFLYISLYSSTFLCIPVHFSLFLYIPVNSCTSLYIPLHSCKFLYISVHSSTFLYVLHRSNPLCSWLQANPVFSPSKQFLLFLLSPPSNETYLRTTLSFNFFPKNDGNKSWCLIIKEVEASKLFISLWQWQLGFY